MYIMHVHHAHAMIAGHLSERRRSGSAQLTTTRIDSPETELEVKLKGTHAWRPLSLVVVEGQSELDELEQVHIALEQLVLVLCGTTKLPNRFGHNTWKLCVLWVMHCSQRV